MTERDIEDCQDHIRLTFARSKQDQYYSGSKSFLPAVGGKYCPVNIFRMFARQYDFNFGPQGNGRKYLNFVIFNTNGTLRPKYHKTLSYSTSTLQMKQILTRFGIRKSYSETSFKAGGVTAYIEQGESLEATMVHGRWRGLQTPLYYLRGTHQYRLKLAQKIPKISSSQFEI